MEGYHASVLVKEIIGTLAEQGGLEDQWFIDATLGDGGHSLELLRQGIKVLGIDQDPNALQRAQERFVSEGIDQTRFKLVRSNFENLKDIVLQTENTSYIGILFDLGVSSLQLEDSERGFSFAKLGPLDMRMDPNLEVTAADLVNGLEKGKLYELFSRLGEERNATRFAEALVSARQVAPIRTTRQLAEILEKVVGGKRQKIHPATKVFQALRMAVNAEREVLANVLPQSLEVIQKNGFIFIISFHSLEDRIAKTTFKLWQNQGLGEVITKKPIVPSLEEVRSNPRSRSAKLRIFKKL